jgi:hypothetical protein
VLRQSEEEIKELDKEMEEENADISDHEIKSIAIAQASQPQVAEPAPQETAPEPTVKESVDDTDQKELAKSMTKFFDTLVEEAKGDSKK